MARVRAVSARSTASIDSVKRAGSTSANTAVPPARRTALAVGMNVRSGTMTSSPGPMSFAIKASEIAAVPLVTATACLVPVRCAMRSSNSRVSGPSLMKLRSSTPARRDSSPPVISGANQGMVSRALTVSLHAPLASSSDHPRVRQRNDEGALVSLLAQDADQLIGDVPGQQQRVLRLIVEELLLGEDRDACSRNIVADLFRSLDLQYAVHDPDVEAEIVDQRRRPRRRADPVNPMSIARDLGEQS